MKNFNTQFKAVLLICIAALSFAPKTLEAVTVTGNPNPINYGSVTINTIKKLILIFKFQG